MLLPQYYWDINILPLFHALKVLQKLFFAIVDKTCFYLFVCIVYKFKKGAETSQADVLKNALPATLT